MLSIKPSKNLTGISIQGDYLDLSELVDSIYRIVGPGEDDIYYGNVYMRLLGACYDIRHAYMADRDIVWVDNNFSKEKMVQLGTIYPKENLYYSVNILFPEAVFLALSIPNTYVYAYRYYASSKGKKKQDAQLPGRSVPIPYVDFIRDKANLDVLFAGIWQALGQAIGNEQAAKLYEVNKIGCEDFGNYITQYIDKCNIDYIKTEVEKRPSKLKNIISRMIKKPEAYKKLEYELQYWSKVHNVPISELHDPQVVYPEDIEW